MATLDQAIDQMYAAGMPNFPDGRPRVDGKIHRYGPKGYNKSGRAVYRLYPYCGRNGKEYVSGWFRIWGELEITKIRTDYTGVEDDELARIRRDHAALEVQERERKLERSHRAANRARAQWGQARAEPTEKDVIPYMAKKGLRWTKGLKFMPDGTLLVPAIRYDISEEMEKHPEYTGPRRLVSLQKIAPDGQKRFNKDGAVKGAAFRAGPKPKDGDLIMLGEGLATVLSVLQALEGEYTAFVAFSADNLLPVALILRALFPNSPILFLADDDAYIEAQLNGVLRGEYGVADLYRADGEERILEGKAGPVTVRASVYDDGHGVPILTAGITAGGRTRTVIKVNAGRTKSRGAAGEVRNAWVCHPAFAARELGPDPEISKLTDFNDLQAAQGADYVRLQVAEHVRLLREAIELAKAVANGAAPKPAEGGDDGKKPPEIDWRIHDSLLKRFTLVYPTDTAFDDLKCKLVPVSAMRLAFGSAYVSRWLGSSHRRMIDLEQVVFDPTGEQDPKTTVNMFRGLDMKPQAGSCKKLIELLYYLCGEHPEDTHAPYTNWVLNWMAYPLQHLGAKMQTAVVMHGEEGTGKNMVWNTYRNIFGRYGTIINQRQLESRFNTWQSAKLFVVANEVVTRAEMSHHVGILKNAITEPTVHIEGKNKDTREEANHCNLVFLSNELQPLKIGPRDRRYMIIKTPNGKPREFYAEVGAEIRAGGAQALYDFLLKRNVEGFHPHTQPIMTEAKEALIEQGLMPSQLFWKDLHDGALDMPYTPALSQDVYRAYTVWCFRNGHRVPEPYSRFTPNFMSLNGVRRVEKQVPMPGRPGELALVGTEDEKKLRKRRIFLMGDQLRDQDEEKQRIIKGVAEFRARLLDYLSEDDVYGASRGRAREGSGEKAF